MAGAGPQNDALPIISRSSLQGASKALQETLMKDRVEYKRSNEIPGLVLTHRPGMTAVSQPLASSGLTHSNSGNWCRNQVNCRLA